MRARALLIALTLTPMGALPPRADAGETALTYQGALSSGGVGASGFFDMTFRLYSAASGGTLLGTVSTGVQVIGGVFSAELDFGADAWSNADRWLEITVDGVTLAPRQAVTRSPYAITTRGVHVNSAGQVGLGGTATTGNMLTIRDADANLLLLSQGNNFGPKITLRNPSSSTSTVHGNIIFDDGSQLAAIGYVKPFIGPAGLQFSGAGDVHMKVTESGFIGLGGELDPLAPLHYQGSSLSMTADAIVNDDIVVETSDAVLGLYSSTGGTRGSAVVLGEMSGGALTNKWAMGRNTSGGGGSLWFRYGANPNYASNPYLFGIQTDGDVIVAPGGRLGVGTESPAVALHVNGAARVDILEIVGADLAERFPVAGDEVIEPGTVLEIDPDNAGMMRVSRDANSSLVAGVVSGAGGLPIGTIMGNLPGSEAQTPVALSGRVWVKCDATGSAIRPGDLLTTSAVPGHAMRTHDASNGAVLGKAMSALDLGETGLVLVLINLQ
jgi:hypothetical protein